MFNRVALALVASLAVTAAAHAGAEPAETVHIGNFMFDKMTLTVRPGTTVTWVNDDDIPHTVVAKDLSFRSKALDTGDSYSFTAGKAGDYPYFCGLHPHMQGTIKVTP